ncbi:hypothetical protein [Pseudoclavibacter sp. AY1H1]|uniref:DUF7736 domain-containing protein n=1 Tax=Pseudoclavibacter sp. AY1H1 TaxID=2080584 RepID=UPI000CE87736|nr:hypothetical protein [Pseudoclavibacter sp. AY1H1]PPF38355.1 hypothetical protein C5E05_04905 [Pseudoclavibacter sp. AY1H1]
MSTKTFPTLAVVTATSGRLACEIGQLYEVLDHVLDDSLMTHQLPAAARAASPILYRQFPWLEGLVLPAGGEHDFNAALAALVDEHGATLEVRTAADLTMDAMWTTGNALRDLGQIAESTGAQIIGVNVDGER